MEPKIYVNVQTSQADAQRIEREERFWTGPRLVLLAIATLAVAFVILGAAANSTSETYWDDWYIPGGVTPELDRQP